MVDFWSVLLAVLVCLVTIVIIYVTYMSRNFGVFKKHGIQYRTPLPGIGNSWQILRFGFMEFIKDGYRKFSSEKAFGTFEPGNTVLVIRDLDMVQDIMVKHFHHFVNRRTFASPKPLDSAMTQLEDDHWRHVRNTVSPTFSSGKLKRMYPHVEGNSKALTSHFKDACESGKDIEVKDVLGCYTMDVIASTGFGVKLDSLKDKKSSRFVEEAYKMMNFNGSVLALVFLFPLMAKIVTKLGYSLFPKSSLDFFCSFIDAALEDRKSSDTTTKKRNDFVQLVVEESKKQEVSRSEGGGVVADSDKRKGLSHVDIQGQALIFILAGYDTTATAMSFTLHELAHHPDACAKLQEEMDQVLKGEFPTYESVQQLTYLDMCLNEAMRLYPPGFILDRKCQKECVIQGVTIPTGMTVLIPVIAIHHDPTYFPEPDKFNPERFSPENKEKLHPFAHLPFGQGPRMCIGNRLALMEMKIALAAVLQEMTPTPCSKSVYPPKLQKFKLQAEDGLWIKMVPRKEQ